MERASKRQRHVSTDNESDSEGNDDWSPENNGLSAARRPGTSHEGGPTSRSRRGAAANNDASPTPDQSKRSIRLTVKAPPSKLRQVMDADPPQKRTPLARSTKTKKPVYTDAPLDIDHHNDDEDDEDEEEEEGGEEDEDEEVDAEEDEDDGDGDGDGDEDEESPQASADNSSSNRSEDQEDEESDEDEDEPMPDAPAAAPIPTIKLKTQARVTGATQRRRESPAAALSRHSRFKSVEEKELELSTRDNTEDEELSDAQSQREDEEEEEEEEEEDDEEEEDGEEEEEDEEEEEEDGEAEEEEDDEASEDGQTLPNDTLDTIRASAIGEHELSDSEMDTSRGGTPDPSKLTRRQRGTDDTSLLALSNEAQKKKFFTAEQITMRKAEMARRRKDLSEKRNEEEKADTLNRLLHKQAPKRRTRAQIMADAERDEFGTPGAEEGEVVKAKSIFVRTIHNASATRVGVPEEWLGKPVGGVFEGVVPAQQSLKTQSGTRMVQVVD